MKRFVLPAAAAVVALLVLAGAFVVLRPGHKAIHVTAHFPRATSIYVGSSVRILGVSVGKVTKVESEGTSVRVEMEYSGKYKVPANASAVIIPPAIVGDRYVQLSPAYTGGPTMTDGADIPPSRTGVPVELDQIFSSLNDLNVALGPNGANKHGALSDLVKTGAANLGGGNGKRLNTAVHNLSELVQTLDNSKGDLVGTLTNLQQFTTMLAGDDGQVRAVNANLAAVADQLNGERQDLAAALKNLSTALTEVASFVKNNKADLTADLKGLSDVTSVLVKQKRALTEVLDVAPLALQNLDQAFNTETNTLDTRANVGQSPIFCSLLAVLQTACPDPIKNLGQSSPTTTRGSVVPSSFASLLAVRS